MVDADWDTDRSRPEDSLNDLDAERYLLAAMMTHPSAIETAVERVEPEHFYRPAHQEIYRAMVVMYAAREPIDPVTLRAWMERDATAKIMGQQGALYLAGLFELPATAASAGFYSRIVHEHAIRRILVERLTTLRAKLLDKAVSPEAAAAQIEADIRRAVLGTAPKRPMLNVDDFLAQEFAGSDWVVPGLIGRQERIVVVGPEGAGKTMLSHQVAYATAAGVHPFCVAERIEPQRVLVLDFENPETLLQRRSRFIRDLAAAYKGWDPDRLIIHAQPRGADLTDPREVFELAQVIKQARADLIVAGPIYKLVGGVEDDAKLMAHRKVAHFFDQARTRYNCSVWLESHAPYGGNGGTRVMRPEGSNIWAKWPEFGLTLMRGSKRAGRDGLEIGQYRGHREEGREWPNFLTRSSQGGWPWVANWEQPIRRNA